MSDGNTLIGNAMVGHGLQGETPTQGETYLEEAVIAHAEEELMSRGVSSEDDEKVEREMLTVALVNSVVETSKQTPSEKSSDEEAQKRYSLRKRRRPSGEQPLGKPGTHPPLVKIEPSSSASSEAPPSVSAKPPVAPAPVAPAPALAAPAPAPPVPAPPKPVVQAPVPSAHVTQTPVLPPSSVPQPAVPPTTVPQPSVKPAVIPKVEPKARIQLKPKVIPPARVKTEAVPACTVAVAAAPLSIPLAVSSLPTPSSLPPALQPPRRTSMLQMPPPKVTGPTASRVARPKAAKDKSKRLVPAARVPATSQPLTPTPAIGVPNPLSNPLPASKSILVAKPTNQPAAPAAFKAGAKLTVPCPLPPSTFSNVGQGTVVVAASAPAVPAPASEKKKVTIEVPPQQRGRIFSIDLDPASLDFSVLDSGEGGTPAPASADLPLVTGGARDRAFSFECFAFGINADEPLPPLAEQAAAEQDAAQAHQGDFVTIPRPRGDSIIFDPSSFQEGGIHEERALTTREHRGMSVDLEAAGLLPPSSAPADSQGHKYYEHPPQPVAPPQTVSSTSYTVAPAPPAPAHPGMPDAAPSSAGAVVPHPVPAPHAPLAHPHAPPPVQHHVPPVHVPAPTHHYHHPGATAVPHPVASSEGPHVGAVSIISSCASSTTLQMELLNKDGRIGIYLPEARKERIARFHAKRKMRIWRKRIKYDCRKKLADSRPRIKGRFVKRTGTD